MAQGLEFGRWFVADGNLLVAIHLEAVDPLFISPLL